MNNFTIKFDSDGIPGMVTGVNKIVGALKAEEQAALDASVAHQKKEAHARRIASLNQERARLARAERQATFDRLPLEERLNRLYADRERIAEKLQRVGNNEVRKTALLLAQAKTESLIGRGELDRGKSHAADEAERRRRQAIFLANTGQQLPDGKDQARRMLGFIGPALGASALLGRARQINDYASNIADNSSKLTLDVESLQAYAIAARQTGVELEQISNVVKDLNVRIARAVGGSKKELDAFARQGITLADLKSKRPEEIFQRIAVAVQQAKPGAQQLKDVVDMLGKSGADMIPVFKNGFAAAADQARETGQVIEREIIERLDQAGDRWEQINNKFNRTLSPGLASLMELGLGVVDAVGYAPTFLGALSGGATSQQAQAAADAQVYSPNVSPQKKAAAAIEVVEDPEKVRQIAELREKNGKALADLSFETLNAEKQTNELLEARKILIAQIIKEKDPLRREQMIHAELAMSKDLNEIQKAAAKPQAPTGDQLSRIGLIVGQGTSPQGQGHLQRTVQLLMSIDSRLRQANSLNGAP